MGGRVTALLVLASAERTSRWRRRARHAKAAAMTRSVLCMAGSTVWRDPRFPGSRIDDLSDVSHPCLRDDENALFVLFPWGSAPEASSFTRRSSRPTAVPGRCGPGD